MPLNILYFVNNCITIDVYIDSIRLWYNYDYQSLIYNMSMILVAAVIDVAPSGDQRTHLMEDEHN